MNPPATGCKMSLARCVPALPGSAIHPLRIGWKCHASRISSEMDSSLTETGQFCPFRSEEHTSELQSLMRISYAVFCLKKNNRTSIALDHSLSYQTRFHPIAVPYTPVHPKQ